MKKIAQISLMLIYAQMFIGISIANHFCGGELAWQSPLFLQQYNDCGCGDDEGSCGCCETVIVSVQLTDEHFMTFTQDGIVIIPDMPLYATDEINHTLALSNTASLIYELPPGNEPRFIINRTLLI